MQFPTQETVLSFASEVLRLRLRQSESAVCASAESGDEGTSGRSRRAGVAGVDSTGLDLWRVSHLACQQLSLVPAGLLARTGSLLELGAGAGAPGLLCAKLGAPRVVLTDNDPQVLQLLAVNIEINQLQSSCSHCHLDWCQQREVERFAATHGCHALVLACDVLYFSRQAQHLVAAVACLLEPQGVLLLGHETRRAVRLDKATGAVVEDDSDEPLQLFLAAMAAEGFQAVRLGPGRCASPLECAAQHTTTTAPPPTQPAAGQHLPPASGRCCTAAEIASRAAEGCSSGGNTTDACGAGQIGVTGKQSNCPSALLVLAFTRDTDSQLWGALTGKAYLQPLQ